MSKVYVIIEQCNVLQNDYFSYKETVGVAESHAAAESMIEKLKERVIANAVANGLIVTDYTSSANGIVKVILDNGGVLTHDVNDYEWYIEEYELFKES